MAGLTKLKNTSGSIVNFETGIEKPIEHLKVGFSPVQDLHGRDYPYLSGGVGKNMLPPPADGQYSFTVSPSTRYATVSDGIITLVGSRVSSASYVEIPLSKPYTFNANTFLYAFKNWQVSTSTGAKIKFVNSSTGVSTTDYNIGTTNAKSVISITGSAVGLTADKIVLTIASRTAYAGTLELMVCDNESETEYVPYGGGSSSNICLITGHTELSTNHYGLNMFDINNAVFKKCQIRNSAFSVLADSSTYILINGIYDDRISVKVQTTAALYAICTEIESCPYDRFAKVDNTNFRVSLWDEYKTNATRLSPEVYSGNLSYCVIPANTSGVLALRCLTTNASSDTAILLQLQTFGNTLTSNFPSYRGEILEASWETEAGTVYGGSIDFVTGELSDDYISVSVDGSDVRILNNTSYIGDNSTHFYTYVSTPYDDNLVSAKCSAARKGSCDAQNSDKDNMFSHDGHNLIHFQFANSVFNIDSADDRATRISKVSAYLSENPIQIVYKKRTPDSYELDPQEVIPFSGVNTFYSENNVIDLLSYYILMSESYKMQDVRRSVMMAQPHIETASDVVASFTTDLAAPLKECSVAFNPVQDLHGWDKPWPAGGFRNILPFIGRTATANSVNISYDEDLQAYTLNGTFNTQGNLILSYIPPSDIDISETIDGVRYLLSVTVLSGSFTIAEGTGITYAVALFNSNNSTWLRGDTNKADGSSLNGYCGWRDTGLSSTGNYQLMFQCWRAGSTFNNLKFRVQIEKVASGTTTPSTWRPFSNVCPFTGWDSFVLTKCKKNRFDTGAFVANARANGLSENVISLTSDGMQIKTSSYQENKTKIDFGGFENEQYTLSFTCTTIHNNYGEDQTKFGVRFDYIDGTYNTLQIMIGLDGTVADYSLTSIAERQIKDICIGNWGYGGTVELTNIQLEKGTTATEFEAYDGSTWPVSWHNNGDITYQGYYDLVANKMVINRKMVTITNVTSVTQLYLKPDALDGFERIDDIYPRVAPIYQPVDLISDTLKFENNSGVWGNTGHVNCWTINLDQVHVNIANSLVGIIDYTQETTVTAKEKLNAWLAENPINVLIPIEPIVYQFTPVISSTFVEYFKSFKGKNTFVSTANGDVTVKFWKH